MTLTTNGENETMNHANMQPVITYQHAYIAGTSTLCARHSAHPPSWVPALGPVSHGQHAGRCAVCDTRYRIVVGEKGSDYGHVEALEIGSTEGDAQEMLARTLKGYGSDGWGRVEYSSDEGENWERI